jgi:hypothetical protein
MSGEDILKIYELAYYILKLKLTILQNTEIFYKYEEINEGEDNDLVESNIFKSK